MHSTPPLSSTLADALALRAWALRVLAGAAADSPPAIGGDPARAWPLFLRAERCALPLRARLGPDGSALPAEGARALEAYATEEMKRFLSVAAQLRTAGAELARRGWKGVVLKGGAAAADGGEPLDVIDLDLLVEPAHAAGFAALLERGGFRAMGADPGGTLTGGWELASRHSEGSVRVEVHYAVPHLGPGVSPWEGIRPTRVPGIHRPAAATHLWHVLVHSVVHHLERRGQLRELLLLRCAMEGCTAEALEQVRQRVEAHPARRPMELAWEMAEALGSGRAPADAFRPMAATRMAMAAGAGDRLPEWLRVHGFFPSAYAMAAGEREYRRLWRGTRASVLPSAGHRGDAWLDRRLPAAAWAARVAMRGARMAASFPAAWRLHRQLRPLLDASAE